MRLRVQDDNATPCHPEGAAAPRPKDHLALNEVLTPIVAVDVEERTQKLGSQSLERFSQDDPSVAMKLLPQDDI
jgi:hypothetical protein